ncbi:MAG: transporter substrate-binding domain-containing protein [Bacteroidales bacterium]|jgi:ABC-type amino acid transport substrate-binding protein|nr:transporter substrate-binding domain-containing protein [Bacteroidales bacterium]MDD4057871.1 transporter substrate-binding domain-containing protein [Bacteroidales bacterium]
MKNKVSLFLIFLLVLGLTSCGQKSAKIETLSDLQGKVIGNISSGVSDSGTIAMLSVLIGGEPAEVISYNRGIDVLAALKSGKIDGYPSHQFAADYLLKRDSQVVAIPVLDVPIEGHAIMAVRTEDFKLKTMLDSAIIILRDNGTISALEQEWIMNLPAENEPTFNEIPVIEGAPSYYVGVAGDLPPLDYVASDGFPAGFNVALLSEIGKILNINFKFVSLETQARFTALASKKIDVIFCHFQSTNTEYFNELKNEGWVATQPYFVYKGGSFIVNK